MFPLIAESFVWFVHLAPVALRATAHKVSYTLASQPVLRAWEWPAEVT